MRSIDRGLCAWCEAGCVEQKQNGPDPCGIRASARRVSRVRSEKALAAGVAPKGMEQAFAATLQISPSMWSQIKASRPIGDKLARQIEKLCGKQSGWVDEIRDTPSTCLTDPADGIPQSSIRARRSASGPINRYNIQSARP